MTKKEIKQMKLALRRFLTGLTYTLIVGVAFINAGQTEMFYLTHTF